MIALRQGLDSVQRWVRLAYYSEVLQESGSFPEVTGVLNPSQRSTTFSDRKVFQKAVLLLERRLPLANGRFQYRWDISGPYSSELADEVGEVRAARLSDRSPETPPELRQEIGEAAEALGQLRNAKPPSMADHEWLELLGCIVYLTEPDGTVSWQHDSPKEDVANVLRRWGKTFGEPVVATAERALHEHGWL